MRPSRKVLAALLAIVLLLVCIFGVWLFSDRASPGVLPVTYIGAIDGKGHWKLRFAITNAGKSVVYASGAGQIEILNSANIIQVGVAAPMSRLAPGEGHVVDAVLSEAKMKSIDGKWRITCFYGNDGFPSRIYRWQWGPNGPGARANWLIPQKLKSMPLPVEITSDWIDSPK